MLADCLVDLGREQQQWPGAVVEDEAWCPGPPCLRDGSGDRIEFEESVNLGCF